MPALSVSLLCSVLTTIVTAESNTELTFAYHFDLTVAERGSPCLFTGKIDPSAVINQLSECSSITIHAVTIPPDVTFNLSRPADGISVNFRGVST